MLINEKIRLTIFPIFYKLPYIFFSFETSNYHIFMQSISPALQNNLFHLQLLVFSRSKLVSTNHLETNDKYKA